MKGHVCESCRGRDHGRWWRFNMIRSLKCRAKGAAELECDDGQSSELLRAQPSQAEITTSLP